MAAWLAAAGDIASAYVSDRRTDDPAISRCIVIVTNQAQGPSHLIHAPITENVWIVYTLGKESDVQTFSSLTAALNSIRPVLQNTDVKLAWRGFRQS